MPKLLPCCEGEPGLHPDESTVVGLWLWWECCPVVHTSCACPCGPPTKARMRSGSPWTRHATLANTTTVQHICVLGRCLVFRVTHLHPSSVPAKNRHGLNACHVWLVTCVNCVPGWIGTVDSSRIRFFYAWLNRFEFCVLSIQVVVIRVVFDSQLEQSSSVKRNPPLSLQNPVRAWHSNVGA